MNGWWFCIADSNVGISRFRRQAERKNSEVYGFLPNQFSSELSQAELIATDGIRVAASIINPPYLSFMHWHVLAKVLSLHFFAYSLEGLVIPRNLFGDCHGHGLLRLGPSKYEGKQTPFRGV